MPRGESPNSKANLHMFSKDNQPSQEQLEKAKETKRKNAIKRKTMREAVEMLLSNTYTDRKTQKQMQGVEMTASSVFKKAIEGDMRAVELMLAIIGEKPAEKLVTVNIDPAAEVEIMDALNARRSHDKK